MADVFPPANVNNEARPWARKVTEVVQQNADEIKNLQSQLTGDNRSSAGQMGVLGRQIQALSDQAQALADRVSDVIEIPDVVVTATSTTVWSSATQTVRIPGVGGVARNAVIVLSAFPMYDTSGSFAGPFITVRAGGIVEVQGRVIPASVGSAPGGWTETFNRTFATLIPANGLNLSVQMQAQLFTATPVTARLSRIAATVVYADPA